MRASLRRLHSPDLPDLSAYRPERASFLRAFAGIDTEPLVDNSAAYLASWLRVLRKDSRMVVFAAAAAQKAVDHIRDVKTAEETETPLLSWQPDRHGWARSGLVLRSFT